MTPTERAYAAYEAAKSKDAHEDAWLEAGIAAYLEAIAEDAETVEAVARAIEATMFAPHELPTRAELHQKYLGTTRAALLTLSTIVTERKP